MTSGSGTNQTTRSRCLPKSISFDEKTMETHHQVWRWVLRLLVLMSSINQSHIICGGLTGLEVIRMFAKSLPHFHVKLSHVEQRNFRHGYDSMIQSCKQPAAAQSILDSIGKDECGDASQPMTLMHKGDNKDGNAVNSDTSSASEYLRGYLQLPEGLFRHKHYEVS